MRWAIRLVLLLAVLLPISPFLISSLLIDERGVPLPGKVVSKDEHISVRYYSWTRKCAVAVKYDPPDGYGVTVMNGEVTPDQFDRLKAGDLVPLRYLRQIDFPDYPAIRTLREMHMLPTVRFANQHTWTGPKAIFDSNRSAITAVLTVGLILFLWRSFRVPRFAWAVAICVVVALAISLYSEFPRPTPAPQKNLRTAAGVVKYLDRWEWLFRGHRQSGMRADQPIEVASVQFVPEGRTEPVVAVDLIDDGSLPWLKEHSPVTVEYEASAPRVAYLRGATRRFAQRNLWGVVVAGFSMLMVVAVCWLIVSLLGIQYRRLTGRSSS